MDFTKPDSPNIGIVIPGRSPVTSSSYHESGKRLFIASPGDSKLHVIDCLSGKPVHPSLKCEQEGIRLVEASHHENNVLFSGKDLQQSCVINYWSTYDNKILRKFRGHTNTVTSIAMSPADDTFLTSSYDRTVRLWNVAQAGCIAELNLPVEVEKTPLTGFDSTGLVFAVTAGIKGDTGHYVHLYDARNYSAGAFSELKVNHVDIEKLLRMQQNFAQDSVLQQSRAEWTSLNFNLSGNQILVGNKMGLSIILDGFEGTVQRVIQVPGRPTRPAVHCITPDDKVLLQGNDDGSISCWDIDSGTMIKTLQGHIGPVNCIKSNPKYAQLASSCSQTALWIW
jgi:COMPASS component SWD2